MLDLVIQGGEVVDGSGAPRMRADVGLRGGRIAQVGDLADAPARERVDARGRIVAPGFIDTHTHDDLLLLQLPEGPHPKLTQGVTTAITGNCGVSLAPLVTEREPPAPLNVLGREHWRYARFGDYLDALEQAQPALNAACLVGHSTLRAKHMAQLDRAATEDECALMAADLEHALEAGALGLSTGLYYPPARAATAEEVIAAGAPLREHRGLVAMHIRDEGDAIDAALREALHIGRELGVETVLSHHKLVGRANHGRSRETLALIDDAARSQAVCLDCYPYIASSTMLLPGRMAQSSDVILTWSGARPEAAGRSVFEMAREEGVTPQEMAERLQPGGAIYFAMSEDDVGRILSHPLAMVGSDGLAHDARPHPRLWGTFPRVLGHYVRERGLLTLESAVYKMTGLPARRFGLAGRGHIAPGYAADVVVFDAARVQDRASFEDPARPSAGIDRVYVNGRLACQDGETVDAHAGRVLRHEGDRA
jgi:N-acyl-D-amino-acid deacylase